MQVWACAGVGLCRCGPVQPLLLSLYCSSQFVAYSLTTPRQLGLKGSRKFGEYWSKTPSQREWGRGGGRREGRAVSPSVG